MRTLPIVLYVMGAVALFLALYFWMTAGAGGSDVTSGENWALFVGKWAPTLIGYGVALSVYNLHKDIDKLRRDGDDR
jgi:hypothetical protein